MKSSNNHIDALQLARRIGSRVCFIHKLAFAGDDRGDPQSTSKKKKQAKRLLSLEIILI